MINTTQIIQGVIGLLLVTAVGGYLVHCELVKRAQAQAVVIAEQARDKAEKQAISDRKAKEKSDVELKNQRGAVLSLAKQLRDARSRSGFLPAASPASPSPHRAAFNGAELERALQRLDDGVSGIVAEGDAARVGLDSGKLWAKDITR